MHYSKTAFRNGTEPTILTNIPDFTDVIGQRMDFSEYDLQKLNRLYNCSKFLRLFYITCFWHLKEMRVIHACWTHPDTSERDANIFGEVNCVKNNRNNGTARNNIPPAETLLSSRGFGAILSDL